MLKKLLKYELIATIRIFLPLYAVLLVFAAICKITLLLSNGKWQTPQIISIFIYITILVGVMVMTLVAMIRRFYKNLLTDEGYLMFTLPVKAWHHITSKLIIAMLWTAVSAAVAFVSMCIVAYEKIFTTTFLQIFTASFHEFLDRQGVSGAFVIVELILLLLVGLASNVLLVYVSIASGHLFNKHRILASLGAFVVINTATQILLAISGFALSAVSNVLQPGLHEFNNEVLALHSGLWVMIIIPGLLSTGYFALTNRILTRRLNLE